MSICCPSIKIHRKKIFNKKINSLRKKDITKLYYKLNNNSIQIQLIYYLPFKRIDKQKKYQVTHKKNINYEAVTLFRLRFVTGLRHRSPCYAATSRS